MTQRVFGKNLIKAKWVNKYVHSCPATTSKLLEMILYEDETPHFMQYSRGFLNVFAQSLYFTSVMDYNPQQACV